MNKQANPVSEYVIPGAAMLAGLYAAQRIAFARKARKDKKEQKTDTGKQAGVYTSKKAEIEQAYWNGFRTKCAEYGVDATKLAQMPNMLVTAPAVLGGLGLAAGTAAAPVSAYLSARQTAKDERGKGVSGKPKQRALVAALKELIASPLRTATVGGLAGLGIGGTIEGARAISRWADSGKPKA